MTIVNCARCNRPLKKGEKEHAERINYARCAECLYREASGTDTIKTYNAWLRRAK